MACVLVNLPLCMRCVSMLCDRVRFVWYGYRLSMKYVWYGCCPMYFMPSIVLVQVYDLVWYVLCPGMRNIPVVALASMMFVLYSHAAVLAVYCMACVQYGVCPYGVCPYGVCPYGVCW